MIEIKKGENILLNFLYLILAALIKQRYDFKAVYIDQSFIGDS